MMRQGMTDRLIETGNCYGMKTNLEEITIMRISWEPSPVQIMKDKKTTGECGIFQLFEQHDNK